MAPTKPSTHSTPSTPTGTPTLQARGLCKSFPNGAVRYHVLRELSLDIHPGQLTLVSGPSGCGKSTLLALLSALEVPDAGEVHALGERLTGLGARALQDFRLRHTGFVFQGFNLFPALKAWEQVALPLGYMGLSDAEAKRRALAALDEVGLADQVQRRQAELSGGERQRVAIARAIAKAPQLLFADEPTSALDAENGRRVVALLHRIARTHGTTVLCVSHDPRLVRDADRVLSMEDGRIHGDWRPAPGSTHPEPVPS